jgi:glucan biosynthesis protein C
MDAMRGILMMLGLLYHSAKTFSTQQDWIIHTAQNTFFADIVIQAIHIFRMPTFYVISGYFAALTLRKYGVKKFLNVRISRIMIPLIVTALTLNSLQAYILVQTGWMEFDLVHYITKGGWITHLWFLLNLVLYFLFFALLFVLFRKKLEKLIVSIDRILDKVSFTYVLLFILPFIVIGSLVVGHIYPTTTIIKSELLFRYLPFFLFGVLLQYHKGLLDKFTSYPPKISFLVAFLTGVILFNMPPYEGLFYDLFKVYIFSVGMWFSASFCFHIFKKWTNYASELFKYLSDVSYTVYLFHHSLIIFSGIVLIEYHIGGVIGMAIQIIFTTIVALSIDRFLISRYKILSLLFNGKVR